MSAVARVAKADGGASAYAGLEEAPQANYGTAATIPTLDPELARQLGLPTAEDDDEALARPPRSKMEAFGVKATTLRPDNGRNTLIVTGSGTDRAAAIDTILSFDADWMRGQSVGIFPIHNSSPEPVR